MGVQCLREQVMRHLNDGWPTHRLGSYLRGFSTAGKETDPLTREAKYLLENVNDPKKLRQWAEANA